MEGDALPVMKTFSSSPHLSNHNHSSNIQNIKNHNTRHKNQVVKIVCNITNLEGKKWHKNVKLYHHEERTL